MAAYSARILWFSEITKEDISLVGQHGTKLGDLVKNDFPIPEGFVVTSRAYFQFIDDNNLSDKINALLSTVSYEHPESLMQVSGHIKKLFMQTALSPTLLNELDLAYRRLGGSFGQARTTLRSSVTARDLPTVSFAGHHHSFENIHGEANLILKIREIWASFFEPQALVARHHQQFNHLHIAVPVIIQKMVTPEKSGVMFTLDPVTNDKSKILIEAVNGDLEPMLSGEATPDHYMVTKRNLTLINKRVSDQSDKGKQILSDNKVLELALLGRKLDDHHYFTQDIKWAIEKRHIYLLDVKHFTAAETHKIIDKAAEFNSKPSSRLKLLLKGSPASPGIAKGQVRVIHEPKDIQKIVHGDVVVLSHIHLDYASALKKAGAIITDQGGRAAHGAVMARHLGIPTVVGSMTATEKLVNGTIVTVNGTLGEVYEGVTNSKATNEKSDELSSPINTHVYVALSQSHLVQRIAKEHVHGVGMIKGEVLMKELDISPAKALEEGKKFLYINQLADKIEIFCKGFHPRPVFYRFSDKGSLLGLRGTYKHLHYQDLFLLEVEAVQLVRERGYKNLGVIVPLVRKVEELVNIKRVMSEEGLSRSASFKIWMMVQTPANALLIDEFIKVGIDGVSIDTTELAMLTLGIDPSHAGVAHLFDEIDPSVLIATAYVIAAANKHHISSSLSGLAPSLYSSLIEKAVLWGVTSITVSPDAISATRRNIGLFERKLVETRASK
jgi:pyruvate,water dikinase